MDLLQNLILIDIFENVVDIVNKVVDIFSKVVDIFEYVVDILRFPEILTCMVAIGRFCLVFLPSIFSNLVCHHILTQKKTLQLSNCKVFSILYEQRGWEKFFTVKQRGKCLLVINFTT